MKTLHFTDAEGILRTEKNVKNVKITEEKYYKLTLNFSDGTKSVFEGEYDYLKSIFNSYIDNPHAIELNIIKL